MAGFLPPSDREFLTATLELTLAALPAKRFTLRAEIPPVDHDDPIGFVDDSLMVNPDGLGPLPAREVPLQQLFDVSYYAAAELGPCTIEVSVDRVPVSSVELGIDNRGFTAFVVYGEGERPLGAPPQLVDVTVADIIDPMLFLAAALPAPELDDEH